MVVWLGRALQDAADISPHYAGSLTYTCIHCHALHWLDERVGGPMHAPVFSKCCARDKVVLPHIFDAPLELQNLFSASDQLSTRFRHNARHFNNMFAFLSLGGVRRDMSVAGQAGVYTYKVQGQAYHSVGSLLPAAEGRPSYAQTYFVETDPATESGLRVQNASSSDTIDVETVQRVQSALYSVNPYASFLKSARAALSHAADNGNDVGIRIIQPDRVRGADPRTYNRPSSAEVAALILSDAHASTEGRDIIIYYNDGPLKRISDLHPSFLPLRFPLLIPYGHFGWSIYIPLGRNTSREVFSPDAATAMTALNSPEAKRSRGRGGSHKVSLEQFHCFHLHYRHRFSTLFHAEKLLQEYVVDAWIMIEQDRTWFHRQNQDKLRADLYKGLQDALMNGQDLNSVGRVTVLPSTFTGGPRWWQARYHDAVALSREHGRPDLFITMTCNVHWKEIQDELLHNQTASDRPDLVARVFWLKLDHLLDLLTKKHVMGKVVAHLYSVEFQKRGLPHAHILLFLHKDHKLNNPAKIDSAVCAELPDPSINPGLHATVLSHMIHGPCTPAQPCMQSPASPGRCSRRYPRPFRDVTLDDVDGYPEYRRREDGVTATKRVSGSQVHTVDSRWVVPYNPFLLQHLDCHMNVEICTAITAVKYLFKYVYKGPDRITVTADGDGRRSIDEISEYLDARYVSPCEAAGRIYEFALHGIFPSVIPLDIHLEGEHRVVFNPDDPDQAQAQINAETATSKLLGFFDLCKREPVATRNLTYANCPAYYVWQTSPVKSWEPRKRNVGEIIGRIYYAPHASGEKFYLRRLLHVVTSPKGFEDLRTFRGEPYPTFHAACVARGLISDDGEWHYCLEEASHLQTGSALRHLYCTIITNHEVGEPSRLYHTHRVKLADDCSRRLQRRGVSRPSEDRVLSLSRALLRDALRKMSPDFDLDTCGVPPPDDQYANDLRDLPSRLQEELSYDRVNELASYQAAYASFSTEQRLAFDEIKASVDAEAGGVFFLDGPGGSGKTFLENALLSYVRGHEYIALAVASSGIAAIMLEGGRTAHNRFKVPFTIAEDSICSISAQSVEADIIRRARLIIWDEAPMQHRHIFEAVNRLLIDLRKNEAPFGGCVVLFSGDWRQTLPIIKGGSDGQVVQACMHKSLLWPSIRILRLSTNQRLFGPSTSMSDQHRQFQEAYNRWILSIGEGKQDTDDQHRVEIPAWMRLEGDTSDELIEYVYGDRNATSEDKSLYWSRRAILHARNADVDATNDKVLSSLTGESTVMLSADEALTPDGDEHPAFPAEHLATINPPGVPPHRLCLKKGAPVMLLRNLNPSNGLCNGTRLIVTHIGIKVVEAMIITGASAHRGKVVLIPRIDNRTGDGTLPFILSRRQFPIKLCFAMTINKSQGQSIQKVGIDLRTPCFSHGQLYVALSRATDGANVRILLPPHDTATPNIVLSAALPSLSSPPPGPS